MLLILPRRHHGALLKNPLIDRRQLVKLTVVVAATVLGLPLLADDRPAASEETPSELQDAQRFVYKSIGDVSLPLYVFKPSGWHESDQRPAILFYFGGGFRAGSPTQFATQAEYLASRGMVAVCVEYRVHTRHQTTVADCIRDAKSAMRWVRSHAAELGVDPQRIASSGGSAGGHLAAAVGLLKEFDDPQDDLSVSCLPNAMILFNPAVDLTREGLGRTDDDERYNDLITRLGAEIPDLSPTEHVKPGLPPCIIFHGTEDPTVPYAQEVAFRDKMTVAGNRCELVGYDGYEHGFFNAAREDKRPYYDTLRRADEFLASLGYLDGPPTLKTEE